VRVEKDAKALEDDLSREKSGESKDA
jgi:hypothetical protein